MLIVENMDNIKQINANNHINYNEGKKYQNLFQ